MKKIKKYLIILILVFIFWTTFAAWPDIYCEWLPWCWTKSSVWVLDFIWKIVAELIKYVAVAAVFALIASWFMYMFSWWDDAKTKKARNWIIWSLVAVFISISAYYLISLINNARISL